MGEISEESSAPVIILGFPFVRAWMLGQIEKEGLCKQGWRISGGNLGLPVTQSTLTIDELLEAGRSLDKAWCLQSSWNPASMLGTSGWRCMEFEHVPYIQLSQFDAQGEGRD